MKRKLMVGLMVALASFSMSWTERAEAAEQELIVSAAASLTNAFQEIGQQFETANPGSNLCPILRLREHCCSSWKKGLQQTFSPPRTRKPWIRPRRRS